MRRVSIATGLGFVALLHTPLHAAVEAEEPVALTPSSPWQADFGDESCALKRTFGEGPDQVMLELRKFGPINNTQVTVLGTALAPSGEQLRIHLPGASESIAPKTQVNRVFEGGYQGITGTVKITPAAGKATEGATTEPLRIEAGFTNPIALEVGSMEKPVEVLFHCTKNLLRVWGVTESVDDKRPKMARLLNSERVQKELREKYNGLSSSKMKEGRLKLRILVDADGKPTSCHDQDLGEIGQFAETACQTVMRLGRFSPGEIEAGQPVASYYLLSATYANM